MKFIDAALEATISQELPDILKEKKLQSANALKALKTFPPKTEQWKYTLFRHLNDLLYSQEASKDSSTNSIDYSFQNKDRQKKIEVTLNDGVCKLAGLKQIFPKGVSIESFVDWYALKKTHSNIDEDNKNDAFQKIYNEIFQSFSKQEPILEHLNILFCKDIYLIKVAPHTIVDFPLHFYFQQKALNMIGIRLFFYLQQGSQVKVVIHEGDFKGLEKQKDTEDLSVFLLRAKLEEKSSLDIDCIQYAHSRSTFLTQNCFDLTGQGAILKSVDIHLGEGHLRNNRIVHLKGIQTQVFMHSLSLLRQQSHFDSHFYIQHISPQTVSRLNARSVLLDISRYVFNGWVCIDKEAQKSDSDQISKNLILSPLAEADVKPELDVFASDVKATHGSTVGQLNEDEIFYLQSRGLSYKEVIKCLSTSFLQSLLTKIKDEHLKKALQKQMITLLEARI